MEQINNTLKPILEVSQPEPNPLLEIQDNQKLEGDLKISEAPNQPPSIEAMGKNNILEWVKNNMAHEFENGLIESVTPEKRSDEYGNHEWRLIDVKQPKTSKHGEEEIKTFLEIQTTWVIKTKDGQVRRPTQFLMTGIGWPKADSAKQLEAIRRATIAIDLYTHTMARPLYKKDAELPEGFRFTDLVIMPKLSISVGSTGALGDKMSVEVATPKGQGGKAKAMSYQLSEMVNRAAAPILGGSAISRNKIDFGKIDSQARHAIVKESNGREVNPQDRESYLVDEHLNELYSQIQDEQVSYDEGMRAILADQQKLDNLLVFMGKNREHHIVDFNVANGAIHTGPETRTGVWLAKFKKNIAQSAIFSFGWGKTQQQLLSKHLGEKKELESCNVRVAKQEKVVQDLQSKKDNSTGQKQDAFTNQLEVAQKELTALSGEQLQREEVVNTSEMVFSSLLWRMQEAHDFLSRKMKQYEHLALFIAAKAAGMPENEIYDIDKFAENHTLDQLLKQGKNKLTSAEHYFISTFLGAKGGKGVAARKGMAAEMENMKKIIDQVHEKLGRQKPVEQIGVKLEEVNEENN